jgi:flagellar basal body-associated protein FliL
MQKAKLDILENLPDIEITDASVEIGEASGVELPTGGERWAFNKLILIGAPLLIAVLLVSGMLWFYLGKKVITQQGPPVKVLAQKKEKNEAAGKVAPLVAVESGKINKVFFKDFVIDLKDKAGKSRILMCDVVLDVNEEKKIAQMEGGQNVRNLIYQTAKVKNVVALKSLEERKRLKKELSVELNKIFGNGTVKNVYFTSFIIM